MEQMYSFRSAAEILDISVKTIRRLVHDNNIQIKFVGRGIRISETDLKSLIRPANSIDEKYKEIIDGVH